jgi:hypothetical protein
MIVEERIYTLRPGEVPEYLRRYEEAGLNIQRPTLGRMVGYFSTEVGPLNQIVHLWAYRDMAERHERREGLTANADWRAYVKTVRPLIVSQESKILIPARFSPPQDETA